MTKSDSNRDLCLSYLRKYSEKNLNAIESMFSDNIILRDWKIRVSGKKNALRETRKNFEAADSIGIKVLSTLENKNSVAAELKINVDNKEELFVVDVITFNSKSQIESIRAYLGRGDS
ncbi:MAG: nuclear transport factor 2 family protein [Flavobacteriaceae bacterium]